MDEGLRSQIQELCDRQAIRDCLMAYSRGVDRLDRELLISAYHPDAIDDHGVFVGGPEAFADWVFALHGTRQTLTTHYIINHFCELDGDVAHAETHYLYVGVDPDNKLEPHAGGRYIDRFERRNGRWAIAARKCVSGWRGRVGEVMPLWALGDPGYEAGRNARDRSDPSYERPLTIDPQRIGRAWPPFDLRD